MYLGFSWLFSWSFKTESKPLFNFFVIIFAIVLGVSMETFQNAMHLGRSFEWWDVIANSTGALFGLFIYYLMAVRVKPTNSLDNTR